MPKSMLQPNYDSTPEYFKDYCKDQITKIKLEMTRLNKRLTKLDNARILFEERFGMKLEIGD